MAMAPPAAAAETLRWSILALWAEQSWKRVWVVVGRVVGRGQFMMCTSVCLKFERMS